MGIPKGEGGSKSKSLKKYVDLNKLEIGHFGVAQGTGASFKFAVIDKLAHYMKVWSFDQVWFF